VVPLPDNPGGKDGGQLMDHNETDTKMYNQFLDQERSTTIIDRLNRQKELMDKMPATFQVALVYIMKNRIKVEDLSQKFYLSVSSIARLRSKERLNYNLEQIIAICVAMQLPSWLSEA
jgi:DNA-binding Xre family transcriptional regulator